MLFIALLLLAAALVEAKQKTTETSETSEATYSTIPATGVPLEGINSYLVQVGTDLEWYVTANPTKFLSWAEDHQVLPSDAAAPFSLRYLDYFHFYKGTVPTAVAFGAVTQAEADALGSLAILATASFPSTYTYSDSTTHHAGAAELVAPMGVMVAAAGVLLL